ncbi:MAG: PEP-CTERM sorting domain-containing protein [Caulobacteraceae bacterium]|nr:PEP-CTERM sorting domain-containing protein [Caulobacteraceae bacterium]
MRFRSIIAASAAVCGLATAAHASKTIDVTYVSMNNPVIVTLTAPGIDEEVYDSALLLTNKSGSTIPVFCVDIWHEINLGPANITFEEEPLKTDSSGSVSGTGNALSGTQIGEIGGLVDLGTNLIRHGDSNLATDLAGIQGAIWSIENPKLTISGASSVLNSISSFETYALTHQSDAVVGLYDVHGVIQGQAMGVPEPATWALMLLGFSSLGAALRRRQLAPAQVAQGARRR